MNNDAPAPLVPAEVDLRGYDFMPLYGHHLFGSDFNARVSDSAWRAAITLWWAAWNQVPSASLPNDDTALTRLSDLGRDVKAFRKLKSDALHGFVLCSDGRLYHRALAQWAMQAWERRLKERQRKAAYRASRGANQIKKRDSTAESHELSAGQYAGQSMDVPAEREAKRSEAKRSEATGNLGLGLDWKKRDKDKPSSSELRPDAAVQTPNGKRWGTAEDLQAAQYVYTKVIEVSPTAKEPAWPEWANSIRLMRERDGRSHREICELFRWANADTFWRANILCPESLRDHWTQLDAKRRQNGHASPGGLSVAGQQTAAAAQRILEREPGEIA